MGNPYNQQLQECNSYPLLQPRAAPIPFFPQFPANWTAQKSYSSDMRISPSGTIIPTRRKQGPVRRLLIIRIHRKPNHSMQTSQTGRNQRRNEDVPPNVGQSQDQNSSQTERNQHDPIVDLEVEDGYRLVAGKVEEEPCGEEEDREDDGEGMGDEKEDEDEDRDEGVVEAEVVEVGTEAGGGFGEGDGEGEGGEREEVAPGAEGAGGGGEEVVVLGWGSTVGCCHFW